MKDCGMYIYMFSYLYSYTNKRNRFIWNLLTDSIKYITITIINMEPIFETLIEKLLGSKGNILIFFEI